MGFLSICSIVCSSSAWDIFFSQWLETIRGDEGEAAAADFRAIFREMDIEGSLKKKARVLAHQLSSLTLLAYSSSLSAHTDAPMYGHTIGALTVEGRGSLTLYPAWGNREPIEVKQGPGDFYSFSGPYRDDATHATSLRRVPPSIVPHHIKKASFSHSPGKLNRSKRWAVLVRSWLPGRIRFVRLRDKKGGFVGYRHLGTHRMDSDEETRGLVYQDIVEWGKEDERRATPSYASLRRAMKELGRG
ncbi:hypothetical protein NSK_003400 [Nannochloropsis salina CCMP1776]|uniref:Uncharacterized protein n=1 Tax=Nannochloropsis salina CCMP1776 TaxID=1027361 RepID=A0A4D9D2Z3_9STRA|nr:hypothetical protein NSK_003400 [Nannochloropsis salina CCMP1776]|eukprot:TFJ85354.1 hypothetical protein NSK_003400 [Nannochloropsis salina CCMP1776]